MSSVAMAISVKLTSVLFFGILDTSIANCFERTRLHFVAGSSWRFMSWPAGVVLSEPRYM